MDALSYFKLQAKNLQKDYKTRFFNEKERIYDYHPKYFDIVQIFLDYGIYDDAKDFSFTLMNAQHIIARLAGFYKWNELIKASQKELELAKLLFENAEKVRIEEWKVYIDEAQIYNKTEFDAETKIEIFNKVFLENNDSYSFTESYKLNNKIQKYNISKFSKPLRVLGWKNIYNNNSLIFEIPTEKKGSVFMSVDSGYLSDTQYIVILDSRKFDTILGNKSYFESENPLSNPEYQVPYIQPKIEQCIAGFSHGIENPVPLSEVSYFDNEVEFTNGRTRFSWLVAAGACSIPVECDKDSANELFELYGDDRFTPHSIQYYFDKEKK